MDEADPRVQLGVAGESFLQTRHADEHHPDVSAIVELTELLEARRLESVGFVDQEQVGRLPNYGLCRYTSENRK